MLAVLATGAALFGAATLVGQSVRAAADEKVTLERFEPAIQVEPMVITGSAVPVIPAEAFQPITTISQVNFEDAGSGTLAEGLRTLVPGFFGEAGTELRANGGTGVAKANLRGLGGTLTLLDGQRSVFDELNLIPLIAVQGMEIAKDGASARYGADALTGVFNTVLVPSYQGAKVRAYYGNTTGDDMGTVRVGFIAGAARGKTDIVVAGEYYDRNAVMSRDRPGSADADARSQGGQNWREYVTSGLTYASTTGLAGPFSYRVLAPGKVAGYTAADFVPQTLAQYYNPRADTALIPEQASKSVYARINHQILPGGRLEAFARLLFSQSEYESAVSPLAINPVNSTAYPALSPHLPTNLTVYYPNGYYYFLRTASIGPRGRIYEREVYDFQAGLKGKLPGGWNWDATYLYSWWYRDDTQTNSIEYAKLAAAIHSGAYNPFALDSARGVNPNNGRAFDNPDSLRNAAVTGRIDHDFGMRGGSVRASGPVLALPAGKVQLAVGGDYTLSEQSVVPDRKISPPPGVILLGFNPAGFTASGYEARGVFAEVVVPLISSGQGIAGVRDLRFNASVRRSEKDVNGAVRDLAGVYQQRSREFSETTPKVGLLYRPVRDVMFRATYAEGFRTPSLGHMFAAAGSSQLALSDPLGFTTAGAVTVNSRGNPDLEPEESKTWNVGFVYTPKAVKGFRIELDYYRGVVSNLVADGAQYALYANALTQGPGFRRGVASTINPNAAFAGAISRNPTTGVINSVSFFPVNASSREASGLDGQIVAEWPFTSAKVVSVLAWNTTLNWDLTTADGQPSQNWLGRYVDVSTNSISPGSIPRHRGRFMQGIEKGPFSLVGAVNRVSHLEDDATRTQGNRPRYIGQWTTFDAQIGYRWKSAGIDVRAGVNNFTDEPAPFAAGAVNAVSNASYDVTLHNDIGRFVYVQVTKTF